jgi:ABC-type transporter Mla maintaining outer membrane lipid asymmetry ATPase subunit MlaF
MKKEEDLKNAEEILQTFDDENSKAKYKLHQKIDSKAFNKIFTEDTDISLKSMRKDNSIVVEAKHLTYSIENDNIITDVNISLSLQECLVILGTTGSGKSTLLKLMSGILNPTKGTVKICNKDINSLYKKEKLSFINKNLAFVFQDGGLIHNLSVYENIVIPLKYYGRATKKELDKIVNKVLERFNLLSLKDKLPGRISQGRQRFVGLVRAFVLNPRILFLDEPTANLDLEAYDRFIEMIRKYIILGGTVIAVTSDMLLANSIASQMGILSKGKILEIGSPSQIKLSGKAETKKVIKKMYNDADLADEILKLMTSKKP